MTGFVVIRLRRQDRAVLVGLSTIFVEKHCVMETVLRKRYPRQPRVPDYLIREVLDGKPVFYKGYKAVLRGQKKKEEIMGISSLQSLILWYLSRVVLKSLDDKEYFIFTGEPGLHIALKNNLSGDLMIYDRSQVSLFNAHYFDTPPLVNVEIDVKIRFQDSLCGIYGLPGIVSTIS